MTDMLAFDDPLAKSLLINEVIKEIKTHGPISFARYMQMALYHPNDGYYFSENFVIGKGGDFTTAAQISPLYAQCFAQQCQQILSQYDEASILELGSGSGQFAVDLLLALRQLNQLPKKYYIYEISPALIKKQQSLLKTHCAFYYDNIIWMNKLEKQCVGIVIANEVLDALPCHRFRVAEDANQEMLVTYENDKFSWYYKNLIKGELYDKINALRTQYYLPLGYESEINLQYKSFLQSVITSLDKGIILLADYGYGQNEYYHPERYRGTFKCFYQHHHHDNAFVHIGKQDMTAHVDFTAIIEIAAQLGCTLAGFTTQAAFLLNNGLLEIAARTEKNMQEREIFMHHQAMKTLTLPSEMGEVVKVMALAKNCELDLVGFTHNDRRRDL